eukprot:157617-Prymnesium_polylepis.1
MLGPSRQSPRAARAAAGRSSTRDRRGTSRVGRVPLGRSTLPRAHSPGRSLRFLSEARSWRVVSRRLPGIHIARACAQG